MIKTSSSGTFSFSALFSTIMLPLRGNCSGDCPPERTVRYGRGYWGLATYSCCYRCHLSFTDSGRSIASRIQFGSAFRPRLSAMPTAYYILPTFPASCYCDCYLIQYLVPTIPFFHYYSLPLSFPQPAHEVFALKFAQTFHSSNSYCDGNS